MLEGIDVRDGERQVEVTVDPWFNSVRDDPHDRSLLRKLKLPE
jgi:hypothetical protein